MVLLVTFDVIDPVLDDKEHHRYEKKDEEDIPLQIGCLGIATLLENVPGQQKDKKGEESEIPVEVSADPLPFVPEEAGYHRVFEKMAVLLALVVRSQRGHQSASSSMEVDRNTFLAPSSSWISRMPKDHFLAWSELHSRSRTGKSDLPCV